jgi:hypothetical protein
VGVVICVQAYSGKKKESGSSINKECANREVCNRCSGKMLLFMFFFFLPLISAHPPFLRSGTFYEKAMAY